MRPRTKLAPRGRILISVHDTSASTSLPESELAPLARYTARNPQSSRCHVPVCDLAHGREHDTTDDRDFAALVLRMFVKQLLCESSRFELLVYPRSKLRAPLSHVSGESVSAGPAIMIFVTFLCELLQRRQNGRVAQMARPSRHSTRMFVFSSSRFREFRVMWMQPVSALTAIRDACHIFGSLFG